MRFRSPLSQRIILAFVLLTTVVSGLFTIGLLTTIDYIEENLSTAELKKDLARVLDDYRQGAELRLDEGTAFFIAGPTLPDYLRAVPPGYTEVVLQDQAFFVYRVQEGETSYFLTRDETPFEAVETLLQGAVLGGFALSVLASFGIGLFMARRVIAPVRKLTAQVARRENVREDLPPLAAEYADDEVGALARVFDHTISRLHQALQRETLFTSDVSHELRTPLMVINSSCDVLGARKDLDPYTRGKIAAIATAANEIKGLLEAFLALARGEGSAAEKAPLAAVVATEFPHWQELAAKKGNRLLLQRETGAATAAAKDYPAVLLRTVLGNLVRNAIHHTSEGEICLLLHPGGFELRDTGSGIADDERERVFKPYYRGTASHRDGLGLGLSLVQRICDREGWTITLAANQPTGCCFRIDLP